MPASLKIAESSLHVMLLHFLKYAAATPAGQQYSQVYLHASLVGSQHMLSQELKES